MLKIVTVLQPGTVQGRQMSILPNRRTLRSRWSTLAWAAGICVFAASFAYQGDGGAVDAAASSDSNNAQASALAAEDPD